jgi:hypothetical protein
MSNNEGQEMSDMTMREVIKPEKLIEDGMVAVLCSPGYGTGWSTWSSDDEVSTFVLFDRRLVNMARAGATADDVGGFLARIFEGDDDYDFYVGGWHDIEIVWVPVGQKFRVREYDGSESIRFYDPNDYYTA